MTHNSNWFIESPYPKTSNFYNTQPLKAEPQQQGDDSHWIKPIFISPQPIPSAFAPKTSNQLSPWSKLLSYDHESKLDHIVIQDLIPEQGQQECINQPLFYSGDEDDDPVTPIRHQELYKHEVEEGQLHTTGRKSELDATNKRSRPREKGLRKLSQRAYEIVQDLRNATYKEVAAKLVLQLHDEDLDSENKEEQNIKRRVYDALNVLIALGVLRKDGRRIVSDSSAKKGQKGQQLKNEQLQTLKGKLMVKATSIQEKKRKLRESYDKLTSITSLLQRNEKKGLQKEEVVLFPYIGMFVDHQSSKVRVSVFQKVRQTQQEEFVVRSRDSLKPFGDIDSLKWLKESFQKMTLNEPILQENDESN